MDTVKETAASRYLARLEDGTQRTMRRCLANLADASGLGADVEAAAWWTLDEGRIERMVVALHERGLAPGSIGKHLSALRGVLREAWAMGLVDREIDVPSINTSPVREEHGLSDEDVARLFASCRKDRGSEDRSALGARDAALLVLLYGAGALRGEVVQVQVSDYDHTRKTVRLADREIQLDDGGGRAIQDWISIRGNTQGPLLCPTSGADVELRPLSDQAVLYAVQRRAEDAGLGHLTPTDLRRACIEGMLRRGASLEEVQRIAGHAHPTTTARYLPRGSATEATATTIPWNVS
jgi:site-specific recombinase XerD